MSDPTLPKPTDAADPAPKAAPPGAAKGAPRPGMAAPAPASPTVSPTTPQPGTQDRPAGAPPRATPATAPAAPPRPTTRSAAAVLTALAVALLAGGLWWVLHQQQELAQRMVPAAEAAALREQVRALQQRLAQLEQRPAPSAQAVDLRSIEARLAALEQRPAAAAPSAAPDPALADRLAELDRRLAQAEQAATARMARLARLQAATAALEAGHPVGEIPGAPPALARFAATSPPTEAGLRLAFPAAARRARAASHGAGEAQGIGERVWQRVRSLVTVREGEAVLLGSPAAVILGQAAERLQAGDLAGSVAALEALDPGAATAMADWRAEAQALVAARAALAAMPAE